MPLTKFPRGVSSYGIPLTGAGPSNIWGNTWFVDGTNGNANNNGKDPTSAFALVSQAVSAASAQDTIYVRQRAPNADATDPDPYDDNVTVPYAKYALRIVGTGPNHVNPEYVQIKAAAAGNVVSINAPSVVLENLCFNRGSATTGVVALNGDNDSTTTAWGCLIANCHIRNATSAANAGIVGTAGSYNTIYGCTFVACFTGINLASGATYPLRAARIENCVFLSSNGVAVGGNHIRLFGTVYEAIVTGCHFDQVPTGAFVVLNGEGIISNSYFGTTTDITPSPGGAAIDAAATFFVVGCYDDTGAIIAT